MGWSSCCSRISCLSFRSFVEKRSSVISVCCRAWERRIREVELAVSEVLGIERSFMVGMIVLETWEVGLYRVGPEVTKFGKSDNPLIFAVSILIFFWPVEKAIV